MNIPRPSHKSAQKKHGISLRIDKCIFGQNAILKWRKHRVLQSRKQGIFPQKCLLSAYRKMTQIAISDRDLLNQFLHIKQVGKVIWNFYFFDGPEKKTKRTK